MSQRQQPDDAAAAEHADALGEQPAAESLVEQFVQQFVIESVVEQLVIEPIIESVIGQLVVEQCIIERRSTEPVIVQCGFAGRPIVDREPPRRGARPGVRRRDAGRQRGADRVKRR